MPEPGPRWSPPDPIPDGHTVLARGQRPWTDLLATEQLLRESTGPLPPVQPEATAPLMTFAGRCRIRRGRQR